MNRFETHGEWSINREAFEEMVSDRTWQELQRLVDTGLLVAFTARRKHQDFLSSEAFQQAVDGAVRQAVGVLDQMEQGGTDAPT